MTDKEKLNAIRAEVEKYISAAHKAHTNITEGNFAHLLSFIDSLQEDPVSVDLENAADKYSNDDYNYLDVLVTEYDGNEHWIDDKIFIKDAFIAGAKWYASHNTKLSDNLLLAARKASIDICDIDDKYLDEYPYHPIAEQKFIEGANWQKEQMIKDAIDAKIGSFVDGTIYDVDFNIDSDLKQDDKIKVIIIKNE